MDKKLTTALILAGGKGTRLHEITKDEIPKPMALINGRPILEYAINSLVSYGISQIYVSVGHLHEKIEEYFKDGANFGCHIDYLIEDVPLGSGGSLYFLKDKVDGDFLVCSGDAIFDIAINRMYQYHIEKKSLITLLVHPNMHPYDSDVIMVDRDNRVTKLIKKSEERDFYYRNNVNAGMFIINSETLTYFDELKKVNMEHDFVVAQIPTNRVFAYNSCEYIKDVGTPERFLAAQEDLKNGVVSSKNLNKLQKAVFIDRDGTINKYAGFINNASQIELLPDVVEAIKRINNSEYLAIVVSNQPVIARGEATFEEVEDCFNKIETLLGQSGVYIDGRYYCPHHPHSGYDGEVKELKIACDCRKPNIGLLLQAKKDYNLDLSECVMVGDTSVDIQTAKNAGIKSIKLPTEAKDLGVIDADYYAKSLLEAVEIVLKD